MRIPFLGIGISSMEMHPCKKRIIEMIDPFIM